MNEAFQRYLDQFVVDEEYREVMLELLRIHPHATWNFTKFPDQRGREIYPYLHTEAGYFVECTVIVNDLSRTYMLPVLDEKGDILLDGITSIDVQIAHETCFIICASLHGITAHSVIPKEVESPKAKEASVTEMPLSQNVAELENVVQLHQERHIYQIRSVDVSEEEGIGPHYIITLKNDNEEIQVRASHEVLDAFEEAYGTFDGKVRVDKQKLRVSSLGEFWLAKKFEKVS